MSRVHPVHQRTPNGRRSGFIAPGRYALLAAFALGLTASCEEPQKEETTSLRPVYTHRVSAPDPTMERSFSGVVAARQGVKLGFEIGGRVVELMAEDGENYREGAILAKLDSTGYRADLNNAQAQYAAADGDLQRTLRLYENANASKSQLDTAMAGRETSKANLDIALKRMADATLRMPYDGVIGRVLIDEQQIVTPGQEILTIRSEEGLEIEVGVPARLIDRVSVGLDATVRLGPLPGIDIAGKVTAVSPQISENTTYGVTIRLLDAPSEVLEGMDGEATLELPNPSGEVVTIPLACVAGGGRDDSYVWIVTVSGSGSRLSIGTVARRQVRVGQLRDENHIEILSGLEPGELVISRGVYRVEEGQSVVVDPRRSS